MASLGSGPPRNARQEQIRWVVDDCRIRREAGEVLPDAALIDAHRDLMPELAEELRKLDTATHIESVQPKKQSALLAGRSDTSLEPDETPRRIGRYEIRRILGRGTFGRVFLAYDSQLNRTVALKVPSRRMLDSGLGADVFLEEARNAARLNHPRLVAVYDAQFDGERPFIVQEYVDGSNLQDWAEANDPSRETYVRLLIEIADAVGFAHQHGLIHRDLKPSNILIDREGHPHVADFGLAIHESVLRSHPAQVSGTPVYMSPEQVRGETHHLDDRTDIWGLGVILYELLVGKQPFWGSTPERLFEEVQSLDPRPPRQWDPRIPSELERICLRCLEKRRTDRYSCAADLADDLRCWLEALPTSRASTTSKNEQVIRIMPRGLRSFGPADADFFLELLPGPRDRNGMPDSVHFWKSKIEQEGEDATFPIGIMYGPSGCGKSSLVKAGILPRLDDHVVSVYLEASREDTEARLIRVLAKRVPEARRCDSLPEAIRNLRKSQAKKRKVVIVLDQFEQWLAQSHSVETGSELVDALRHCDGHHVQCVVLVRDDFWLAISRFMRALEVRIREGENSRLVDLFDVSHASKVLQAFGRAYGRLDEETPMTNPQRKFIEHSLRDLAENGTVVCVRLALYAEMMKDTPWIPSSLKRVGGIDGVGVTFLEQFFYSRTAPPENRLHQTAARAVLKALLPPPGDNIKGHMHSHAELMDVSRYRHRSDDFDELVDILDQRMRLITPTEPQAQVAAEEEEQNARGKPVDTFYQLSHDYLVPSLREWLTRKQKETWRGRAELRLEERATLWNARAENQRLPSWWEYATVRLFTRPRHWTEPERQMMRVAGQRHRKRALLVAALSVAMIVAGLQVYGSYHAKGLVSSLFRAKEDAVPALVAEISDFQRAARPLLERRLADQPENEEDRRQQLHARLALLALGDQAQVPTLYSQLLNADVSYLPLIRDALGPHQESIVPDLWKVHQDSVKPPDERFCAGLALAHYEPRSPLWRDEDVRFLSEQLLVANPEHQGRLRQYLRPVSSGMLNDLERLFRDDQIGERRQISAANALVDFSGADPIRLCRLICAATVEQFRIVLPRIAKLDRTIVRRELQSVVDRQPQSDMGTLQRLTLGKQRGKAAITLFRLAMPDAMLGALQVTDDPESRTQFIHACRQRGVTADQLLACLYESEAARRTAESRGFAGDSVMFSLLLALGEFGPEDLAHADLEPLIAKLVSWYAADPSSAIHGATGWLLRNWGYEDQAREVDETSVPYSQDREWFTLNFQIRGRDGEWVQPVTMTFVVFQPGTYVIGSPPDEPKRQARDGLNDLELRHAVRITRPFAVLDREIIVSEVVPFGVPLRGASIGPSPEHPASRCTWYDAVRFCRWLSEQYGLSEEQQAYADPQSLDPAKDPSDTDVRAEGAPRNWPLRLDRVGFRLPTEAEWEIAARSGTRTPFASGADEQLLKEYGWVHLAVNSSQQHQPRRKRPSQRGVFDQHGNLCEWCHDWHDYYATNEPKDPMGPPADTDRIFRGGGFAHGAAHARSAARPSQDPANRNTYLGFRIAITLPH